MKAQLVLLEIEAGSLTGIRVEDEDFVETAGPALDAHNFFDFRLELRVGQALTWCRAIGTPAGRIGRGVGIVPAVGSRILDISRRSADRLVVLGGDIHYPMPGIVLSQPVHQVVVVGGKVDAAGPEDAVEGHARLHDRTAAVVHQRRRAAVIREIVDLVVELNGRKNMAAMRRRSGW